MDRNMKLKDYEVYVNNILTGIDLDIPEDLRDKIIQRILRVNQFVRLANENSEFKQLRSTQVISLIVMLTLAEYYK